MSFSYYSKVSIILRENSRWHTMFGSGSPSYNLISSSSYERPRKYRHRSATRVGRYSSSSIFLYTMFLWMWIIFLTCLFAKAMKSKIGGESKKKQLPPSPPKLPIIGNLHQLGGSLHQSLAQLSKKYGPVMLLHLGSVPTVVISSAEAAREVLTTHDLDSCSRPSLSGTGRLSYNYKDISFAPYSDYWREVRKISVLELFSTKRVQSFRSVREQEVALLVSSLSESASAATPVDLSAKFLTVAADVILKIAFGTSLQATEFKKDRFEEVIEDAEALLGSFSANEYFPYFGWIIDRITGYHAWTERVFHELDNFYRQVINDHLKGGREGQQQEDFVDLMLRIEKEQSELDSNLFTKDNIKAVLMDVFLAAITTSAITLTWAMAELVTNSRVMKKAQEEVRNFIGNRGGRVTESDIDKLQYLKMVIKETLRLHPPVPLLLPRETMAKFNISGYEIYPKTMIQVNVWAIGRDPKYWNNPVEFFPERFIDSYIDFKGQNYEFLPFGTGRRSCPGSYMGTRMVDIVLANLLYFFDWKLPGGVRDVDMKEATSLSLTLSKKEPLILVPVNNNLRHTS